MKVVLLTADYPPNVWSGIGHAVHRQAVDLAALGAHVTVIAPGPSAGEDPGANPRVLRIGSDGSIPSVGGADWVHVHSLALTDLALSLRRTNDARLACTVHTQPWLELTGHPRRRFWLDMQVRLVGSCDAVVFLSAAERAIGETLLPVVRGAHVVPHGVPPPPPRVPERGERQLVMFAGRCTAGKGIRLLAECVRRVRLLSDLRFLIATGHGDAEGSAIVARIAREHGAGCEVAGWLPRDVLEQRLAHAVLALVPSRYEPFGLVALEAMRLGTPVLGASVGGLRETLRDGSGGVLLDGWDSEQWADATVRVAGDTALWTRLHRQGRAFVEAYYRASDAAARLLNEVYCGIARPTSRTPPDPAWRS
jgi:glycosyltransferase involved in cell wall biosynthesis